MKLEMMEYKMPQDISLHFRTVTFQMIPIAGLVLQFCCHLLSDYVWKLPTHSQQKGWYFKSGLCLKCNKQI